MIINRSSDYFLLTDKSVAIVGNAQHLFDRSYGADIDSHDVVIRMNRAAMLYTRFDAEATHGTKTTAWCMWRYKEYEKVILNEPQYIAQMAWFEEQPISDHVHVIHNKPLLTKLWPSYPSTGLMVIDWVSKFSTEKVSVYGFDWKETPTFSHVDEDDDPNISIHNFHKERELCYNAYSEFLFFN